MFFVFCFLKVVKMLRVGQQVVVNGFWMVVEEVVDDSTAFAVDKEGVSHEISPSMVDHYYN